MTASINLQLTASDCVMFESFATAITETCEATSQLNVIQLFNGALAPPSQPILYCAAHNHDVFNFSFYIGQRVHWKIKVKSESINGAIKHTHYAVFDPTSLRLADALATEALHCPWRIDLVEYTSPIGSAPVDTTDLSGESVIYARKMSMIHPTQNRTNHVSPCHAAIFDHCFQDQRSFSDLIYCTFRPQTNPLMSLKTMDVHQLPLAPMEPQDRLRVLSQLHQPPPTRFRASSPRFCYSREQSRPPDPGPPGPRDPPGPPPPAPDMASVYPAGRRPSTVNFNSQDSFHSPVPNASVTITPGLPADRPRASSTPSGPRPASAAPFPPYVNSDPTSAGGDITVNNGVGLDNTGNEPVIPENIVTSANDGQTVSTAVRSYFNNQGASENNIPIPSDNVPSESVNPSMQIPASIFIDPDQAPVYNDAPISDNMNNGYYTRREQTGQGHGQQRQAGQFPPAPGVNQPPPGFNQQNQRQQQNLPPQNGFHQNQPRPVLLPHNGFQQGQHGQQQQHGGNNQGVGQGQPQYGQPPAPAPAPAFGPPRLDQANNGYNQPGQGNGAIPGLMDNIPNNSQYQQQVNPNSQLNNQFTRVNEQLRNLHSNTEYSIPPIPQAHEDNESWQGSYGSGSGGKKKKHRAGVRIQIKKAMAAKGNANPDGSFMPFRPDGAGQAAGLVGGGASLLQGGGQGLHHNPALNNFQPQGHELPEEVLQGLVSMERPTLAKIKHLLQGRVPPELMQAAIEINGDLIQLRNLISEVHDGMAQRSMTLRGLDSLANTYNPHHLRVVDAIKSKVLGVRFNQYAMEIVSLTQEVVEKNRTILQNSGVIQDPLNWTLVLPDTSSAGQHLTQQPAGSTPYNPAPPPASLLNSTREEFMTPGLTPGARAGAQDLSGATQAMSVNNSQSGSGLGHQSTIPLAVNEENEIMLGNQDYHNSSLAGQIANMTLEEVQVQIDRRQSELDNTTGIRARTFQRVLKDALTARMDLLIQARLDRQKQLQAEAAAAAAASSIGTMPRGLNQADTSNNGGVLDHVRRAQEELSINIQPRADLTGSMADAGGQGPSLQNTRQATLGPAFSGPSSATPMDTSPPVAVSGDSQGQSPGQHAAVVPQADASNVNVASSPGPRVPLPPGPSGAGPSAQATPYAPSAPEQGPAAGDTYQPFDNRSVAMLTPVAGSQPRYFQASQQQSSNRSTMSPSFPMNSHPNCAMLMSNVKDQIKSRNQSLNNTHTPSTVATTSNSSPGKRNI